MIRRLSKPPNALKSLCFQAQGAASTSFGFKKPLIFASSAAGRIIATLKLLSQQRRPDSACSGWKNQPSVALHGLETRRIARFCSQDSLP
ncbi:MULTISPECIES: hypothetical protein [Caulobacter]|jgi:hypothetical protein|uniref:Uncharacterized protein n=1 Tax=Caulobacter rhizosphaerae TaxID=2010972 RepID=A0ABU1N5Q1_9CAUL|nr:MULTISPECIES: hypothetical protein [Caulobacter]MDR6533668.1 hypothetical protein [Caulobacter rhizosphaerae]